MSNVIDDRPHLTSAQEAVVSITEGSFMVVAPPGSGKTEIVARRIIRLLETSVGEPVRVLGLTFTKKAAAEMLRRVQRRLGAEASRATITNFHSFYFDVLRHYGSLIDIPSDPMVYESEEDRFQALRTALVDEGIRADEAAVDRRDCLAVLDQIGALKRNLQAPEAISDERLVRGIPLRTAYAGYQGVLRRAGALDFDDILLRTYELLAQFPRVARHYRSLYKYVLLDEGQDTNRAQYENLKLICGTEFKNVMIFADPSQSIYRFSGASPNYLRQFEEDFGAKRISLSDNFRCAKAIVAVAGRLLPATELPAAHGATGVVETIAFPDEESEGVGTAQWIRRHLTEGLPQTALAPGESTEVAPEEIAVLGRGRLQLQAVLRSLDATGIAYQFASGAGGVFDSDAYGVLYLAMKVVASPTDLVLRQALQGRLHQDGGTAVKDAPLSALLERLGSDRELNERALLDCLASSGPDFTITGTMERVVALEPTPISAESDDLIASDRELLSKRWSRFRHQTEASRRTWRDWLLHLTDEPRPDRPGIRVYTVHAAKGLEFKAVQIVGLNEGSFPDFRSSSAEEVEEERRLCYVAATRASRVLRLSRPKVRSTRYGPRAQEASRFIDEMGLHMSSRSE
jgi:DNA helicase-2/ATP-dependent DNA helicase PcrA